MVSLGRRLFFLLLLNSWVLYNPITLVCQALVAWSLRLVACCLLLFIFFILQPQVVPGPLCSGPSVPYYHQSFFLVRGSISFLTRRRISSIASAILIIGSISWFICDIGFIFIFPLSNCILYYPRSNVKQLVAWRLLLWSGPPGLQGRGQYYFNLIPDPLESASILHRTSPIASESGISLARFPVFLPSLLIQLPLSRWSQISRPLVNSRFC